MLNSIIRIEHLTKDYGNGRGVFDLSFSVEKGEVFGFLGPNGAGKTTTIRSLTGLISNDAGYCYVNELETRGQAPTIMQTLGYLPGEIAFFDGMSGSAFIKLMAEMRGLTDFSKAELLISTFEFNANVRIKRMSKGMKQKLAIVVAFMHNPQVLILDEPTSGLDPLMQRKFNDLILEEKGAGKTILMSSHSFEEIEKTCDRVGFIRDGKLVAIEQMHEVRNNKKNSYTIHFANREHCLDFAERNVGLELSLINETLVKVAVVGRINALFVALEPYDVLSLQNETSTLEELFMPYYGE